MEKLTQKRLNEIKKGFSGKKVVVIGDMMLDGYYWGNVNRISPEAPVPVVEIDDEFFRFGGAANVAYNILTLGGKPYPVGVIGDDNNGKIFNKLIEDCGISSEGIVVDNTRPTTTKTRVIAANQHIVRIDKENKQMIHTAVEKQIMDFLTAKISEIDAIILEDYNKGVLTQKLITDVIALAKKNNKMVNVDPKFTNFFNYKDVTVFKPNRKETEDAFGIRIKTGEDLKGTCKELMKKLSCEYVLVTLGAEGIALFDKAGNEMRMPTKARKVADVSGAGDTVISTLTMAMLAGANIYEAAYLANYAGGIVCKEVGIVPIEIDNLFNEVLEECK